MVKKIGDSRAFKNSGANFFSDPLPPCKDYPTDSGSKIQFKFKFPLKKHDHSQINTSDIYWLCWITHLAGTDHHPVGTCKMGAFEKDPMAVVNPQLKVRHIHGLRIADASIIPTIPSGNINIPIIMIGEKLADMIKKEYLA